MFSGRLRDGKFPRCSEIRHEAIALEETHSKRFGSPLARMMLILHAISAANVKKDQFSVIVDIFSLQSPQKHSANPQACHEGTPVFILKNLEFLENSRRPLAERYSPFLHYPLPTPRKPRHRAI